jgi:hypothetical protein
MTHAVCTPCHRRAHHLYWTPNSLLGLRTGIEVTRIGGQGARPTAQLTKSDRLPSTTLVVSRKQISLKPLDKGIVFSLSVKKLFLSVGSTSRLN